MSGRGGLRMAWLGTLGCLLLAACSHPTVTSTPAWPVTKAVDAQETRSIATRHLVAKGHPTPRLLDADFSQVSSKLLFAVGEEQFRVLVTIDHETGKIRSEVIKR